MQSRVQEIVKTWTATTPVPGTAVIAEAAAAAAVAAPSAGFLDATSVAESDAPIVDSALFSILEGMFESEEKFGVWKDCCGLGAAPIGAKLGFSEFTSPVARQGRWVYQGHLGVVQDPRAVAGRF